MRDAGHTIDMIRNFKVTDRRINQSEVHSLFSLCQSFEIMFKAELRLLVEFKIEIIERTTYYVVSEATRQYECRMLFVLPAENKDKVEHFYKKIQELQKLETIKVHIQWKLINRI